MFNGFDCKACTLQSLLKTDSLCFCLSLKLNLLRNGSAKTPYLHNVSRHNCVFIRFFILLLCFDSRGKWNNFYFRCHFHACRVFFVFRSLLERIAISVNSLRSLAVRKRQILCFSVPRPWRQFDIRGGVAERISE